MGGVWTSDLASSARIVVALDVDPRLVQITREVMRKQSYANVVYVAGSGGQLPFRDQSFDTVLSIDVIEHIPDDTQVVGEFNRILRKGDKAIVTTILQQRPHYIKKVIFPGHIREYDPKEFVLLFSHVGFTIEQVFFFYNLFSTISRELEELVPRSVGRTPIIGQFIRGTLSLLTRLNRILLVGGNGGVGIIGKKEGNT